MSHSTASTRPMTIGLDVGDRTTHFCVLENREVTDRGSFQTSRKRLDGALAPFAGAQVVLEAGSQSPWMSRHLREAGFGVHVVDPRRVQLISKDPRKTDRRDAELLARLEAGMPELLGRIHHRSEQAQADLAMVRTRDQMVKSRTSLVQFVRGQAKAFGFRLPSCSAASFHDRIPELVPDVLMPAVKPVLDMIAEFSKTISDLDRQIAELAKQRYPEIAILQEVHGVGPVTATAYV